MFVTRSIAFPYFDGEEITWKMLLFGLVIWVTGGLGFGYTMKLFMNKTINKNSAFSNYLT